MAAFDIVVRWSYDDHTMSAVTANETVLFVHSTGTGPMLWASVRPEILGWAARHRTAERRDARALPSPAECR